MYLLWKRQFSVFLLFFSIDPEGQFLSVETIETCLYFYSFNYLMWIMLINIPTVVQLQEYGNEWSPLFMTKLWEKTEVSVILMVFNWQYNSVCSIVWPLYATNGCVGFLMKSQKLVTCRNTKSTVPAVNWWGIFMHTCKIFFQHSFIT